MTIPKDYTGKKYGKLTVLKESDRYISKSGKTQRRQWLCKCECGNEVVVQQNSLTSGNTKSCGCVGRNKTIERNKRTAKYGGLSTHPHFKRWKGMMERCYYSNHKDYHNYGGRGIEVCDEWRENPREFIRWIEEKSNYEKGLTLDRINVNGNYEPSNCVFSNHTQQALNKNISSSNTSGYPGVTKHGKRWRARITVGGKRMSIGVFETKEEAIKERKQAEVKHFGEILY